MRLTAKFRTLPIKGFAASLLVAGISATLFAGVARAEGPRAADLRVEIDQATLVSLDKPGSEVIIGNPSIADVSVQSSRVLVVTGKSVGLTNLMVLDASGSLIYGKKVSVSADAQQLVTVNKGKSRETYSCSPLCGPALIPGDTPVHNEELAKGIRNKLGLAQAAAEGTAVQQ